MTALTLINPQGGRRTPMLHQAEAAECGLACIAMVAGHHGYAVDLPTLRRRFTISLKGAMLKALMKIAHDLGFNTRALRAEPAEFASLALPAILHWDLSHFVVLVEITRRRGRLSYRIHDPAHGERWISSADMSAHFTGVVLELTPSERFQAKNDEQRLKLRQLWSSATGLKRALVQVALLSLLLQVAALTMPFYMQTAIDTVLPAFDTDLILVMAFGFAMLVLIQMATGWLRALVLLGLGTQLGYQVVVNLFRHMMRLPLPWFERRHVGDVISRFGSTQPLVAMLTKGLMAALLDGVMAVLTLSLMLLYSPALTGLAVVALGLYLALRLSFLQVLKAINVNVIAANAAEQSTMIESVRGILGIKTFGQEANRQRIWQNRKADAVNAQIREGRVSAGFEAGQTAILGMENVLFVYIATTMAIDAQITLGMIFAFQAYKQQFLTASTKLIQAGIDWRLNDVHLARIADIALADPEHEPPDLGIGRPPLSGRLELSNVRFRYGDHEGDVLRGISLVVEPGQTVVIVGPSGGGKTTLMKIMLGLLDPIEGEVLVDGVALGTYGKAAYRRQIGAVMQDDLLYAGSIAENIALFDPEIDMDRVEAVAMQAAIFEDIIAMPMGFESLVGDMGSSLSGGQRQRVLIARALYQRPRIVFADEVTASLDPVNHARIGAALEGIQATKIIITHREFATPADKIVLVQDGVAEERWSNGAPSPVGESV
jgi:ATP-binding cassette subfamily B protein RaxB